MNRLIKKKEWIWTLKINHHCAVTQEGQMFILEKPDIQTYIKASNRKQIEKIVHKMNLLLIPT